MKDYRTLQVWRRRHGLTIDVCAASKRFPKEELFGLTSRQLRPACSSIPADLAEGCGRDSSAELKRFVDIAHGSASEAKYFILPASELGYLDPNTSNALSGEIAEIKRCSVHLLES